MRADPKLKFDISYRDAVERLDHLKGRARFANELEQFVLQGEIEDAQKAIRDTEHTLEENADKFFAACKKVGIKKILIQGRELVQCEDERYDGWPAVWAISDLCDISKSCGNVNQSQTALTHNFFPIRYIGLAVDVDTREEVDQEPFDRYRVVSRMR